MSAAGQAITTYIRNHLQRCEIQQDHPLLLRHVLSGTPSDDDLVSALHSRSGGAHCTLSPGDTRITNFRRGTVVWYLSRAAGVACPFSRAGVRLCDYNENGRVGTVVSPGKERKRERDRLRRAEQSGQKRKRLPRACATRQDSDSESSEEDRPPPKVKLTLRLKPSLAYHSSTSPHTAHVSSPREIVDLSKESESEDESMSEDSSDEQERTQEAPCSLPAYPRQSIDIPCHTPSIDETFSSYSPSSSTSPHVSDRPWRSPSVPFSIASPPPDSEEEEEEEDDDSDVDTDDEDEEVADMGIDMEVADTLLDHTSGYDSPSFDEDEDDFDDYDTQWGESPGPMSPPAQFEDDEVHVKQEPQDVGGFLDAWESLESDATDLKVINVITQAAAGGHISDEDVQFKHEEEDFDLSRWTPLRDSDDLINPFDRDLLDIKQEEEDVVIPPLEYTSMSPLSSPVTPYSTLPTPSTPDDDGSPVVDSYLSHRRYTEPLWRDAVLLGPDSVQLKDLDDGIWQVGAARKSCPNVLASAGHSTPQSADSHDTGSKSPTEAAPGCGASTAASQVHRPSPIQGCSADEQPRSAGSVDQSTAEDNSSTSGVQGPVVVRTCEPCEPAISATELEGAHLLFALCLRRVYSFVFFLPGISVYQMSLGSSCVYRRIDTDFVKITPLVKFFDMTPPDASTLQGSVAVSRGSHAVRGTWLPLASAQALLQDRDVLRVFLSDDLHRRFPQALQDFHSSNSRERSFVQFGPNFQSTMEAKRKLLGSFRMELPTRDGYGAEDGENQPPWDHWLLSPTFTSHQGTIPFTEPAMEPEIPLSPTEEEMFRTLCTVSDWEPAPAACPVTPITPASAYSLVPEVPPVESPSAAIQPSIPLCPPPVEVPTVEVVPCREKPLRRSRRTVVRAASRPRTRSAVKISKAVHS